MNTDIAWKNARNILCVRLDNAGDVLMTVPAIRALKAAGRGRKITLLCSPAGARVRALIPEIDEMLVYEAPWMKASPERTRGPAGADAAAMLAAGSFDGAVLFTVYSQNPFAAAFLCHMAGIPLRAAFCRENPYRLLTTWIPEPEPQLYIRHEVERQLALAAAVGARSADNRIRIRIPDSARDGADSLVRGLGLGSRARWITMHPGASAPSRRYPPERFARVCDLLADRMPIVFTGSGEETALVESIRQRTRARTYSIAGKTQLCELAAFISRSALLISNNTCAVHLASATGIGVIDLYALTNPQHTPWQVPHRTLYADVECKYCYKSVCPSGHNNCLRLVAPEKVADAAQELLGMRSCTHSV